MALTVATRFGEMAQKKGVNVLVVEVTDDLFAEHGLGLAAGTHNFLVANLPADAVIQNAYAVVEAVSDAATSATVALGTAEGGAQIMAAVDLKTKAVAGSLVGKIATGTGQKVFAQVKPAGVLTTIGRTYVVVEYTEYKKNTGEYTQF